MEEKATDRWPVFDLASICRDCEYYREEPGRLTIDPADSYPGECFCEKEMDNFGTKEGCWQWEPVIDMEDDV